MKKGLIIVAVAAASVLAASEANAWERSGSFTGPNGGTANWNATGSCSNGSCSSHRAATGPNGGTWTRDTTVTRTDNGWNSSTTVTGPRGGTYTVERNRTRP